jgi:hypothetical protein
MSRQSDFDPKRVQVKIDTCLTFWDKRSNYMIHMLSNFDLKTGVNEREFVLAYGDFIDAIQNLNLIVKSDPVGRRVSNTPMDTAPENGPEYYSIMSFHDRKQLDAAYAHFLGLQSVTEEKSAHLRIHRMIENAVFTCWEDGRDTG